MPIFEYACAACDEKFETLILRKSDEAEVACPRCEGREVERVVSRPAATQASGTAGSARRAPGCGPVG